MLRFIFRWRSQRPNKYISIHPMLRFITLTPGSNAITCKFQYIQCYGSSLYCGWHVFLLSIRLRIFQYIQCYGSSDEQIGELIGHSGFQYIQCYGSSGKRRRVTMKFMQKADPLVQMSLIYSGNGFRVQQGISEGNQRVNWIIRRSFYAPVHREIFWKEVFKVLIKFNPSAPFN